MKRLISLLSFLFLFCSMLDAQVNLALTATPSASASSSGNYGPSNWNDGNVGPNYYFGWLGTDPVSFPAPWLQYEWSSAVTVNTLVFHPPSWSSPGYVYFYGSATIQYWDGSNWVNQLNFLSLTPTIVDTVEFPEVTTTKLRVANFVITGQHNPGWDEIEAFYIQPPQVDMAITEVISPPDTLWSSNSYPVSVRVKNFGPDIVTTFDISYEIDNQSDSETWTGSLNPGDSGIYQFMPNIDPTLLSSPLLDCEFIINAPGDVDHSNDTLETTKLLLTVGLDEPAGIDRVRVFPNPVSSEMQLINMGKSTVDRLQVFSGGQCVKEIDVSIAPGSTFTINLEGLAPGYYILQAGAERHKLLKVE